MERHALGQKRALEQASSSESSYERQSDKLSSNYGPLSSKQRWLRQGSNPALLRKAL